MKIINKTMIRVILVAIALYVIVQILILPFNVFRCGLVPIFDNGERCRILFTDTIKQRLRCIYSSGNNTSAECAYLFENRFRYTVWEIDDIKDIKLNEITLEKSSDIDQIKASMNSNFTLGDYPGIEVYRKICLDNIKKVIIHYSGELKVDSIKSNFWLASGALIEFAIFNDEGKNQISIFNQVLPTYSSIIFLKRSSSYYMVLINSLDNKPITNEGISLLNIENIGPF